MVCSHGQGGGLSQFGHFLVKGEGFNFCDLMPMSFMDGPFLVFQK